MNGLNIIKCHRYSGMFLVIVLFNKLPFYHAMAENSEIGIFECLFF